MATIKKTARPAAAPDKGVTEGGPDKAAPQPEAVTREEPVPAAVPAAVEAVKPEKDKAGKGKVKDKKKDKKKKKNKEAVMIRFEKEQLDLIDTKADALGLSRAAWVRMIVAQALVQG